MSPRGELTTIKVGKQLREKITTAAAEQHQTVHVFLEGMLADRERTRRLASVAAAYADAEQGTLADWRAETEQWESIDTVDDVVE